MTAPFSDGSIGISAPVVRDDGLDATGPRAAAMLR